MTAENLADNALYWFQTVCYDYAFDAMLARLAESLLETARREPASPDFCLSTYFSRAQHRLDEARQDSILGPHIARAHF